MPAGFRRVEAMATVQGADLVELLVDAGEIAKDLRRPAMDRLLELVNAGDVNTVIVYELDHLTRPVRDPGDLLDRVDRHGVSLVSVSESLATETAAGRPVLEVMASVELSLHGPASIFVGQPAVAEPFGQRAGDLPYRRHAVRRDLAPATHRGRETRGPSPPRLRARPSGRRAVT